VRSAVAWRPPRRSAPRWPRLRVRPGENSGEIELTVTRDYGSQVLEQASESINESDTVLRLLDRNADVETRYGGGFVQSIDGLAGGQSDGRRSDWFFYVNGIESPVGSAEYDPADGDRIWWDFHDWTSAMRVPAVVARGRSRSCAGSRGTVEGRIRLRIESGCATGPRQAAQGGAEPGAQPADAIHVQVGTWETIRTDEVAGLRWAAQRERRVATFTGERRPLPPFSTSAVSRARSRSRAVAALRPGEGRPLGDHRDGPGRGGRAAGLFGSDLRNRFAVATDGGCRCASAQPVMSGAGPVRPSPPTGQASPHRASPGAAVAYLGALALVGSSTGARWCWSPPAPRSLCRGRGRRSARRRRVASPGGPVGL
jgi:hypothetical protein